jgi:hypothetical protein
MSEFLAGLRIAVKIYFDLLDDAGGDHLDRDEAHQESAKALKGDEALFSDEIFNIGGC